MEHPSAFFVADGRRFQSTELTRGPWDAKHQHVGPPAALLARTLERYQPREELMVARITVEILRPVPIAPLEIHTELVRPGRSVELVGAVALAEGKEVLRATAWRILRAPTHFEQPPQPPGAARAPAGPETGERPPFFVGASDVGYHTGIEATFLRGSFREPGPATAWIRMRVPLVAGETPTPLVRVLCAADSGNGVSSPLDHRRYLFINTELTVHLHRHPAGEWVCLDSQTVVTPGGVGLTETTLFDETSHIGSARQSLLVTPRRS